MQKTTWKLPIALISSCYLLSMNTALATNIDSAPVSGYARAFLFDHRIANASVKILETGMEFTTNDKGEFGPFYYPVGQPLTLELSKWGYKTTQSETVIVPKEGLTGKYNNITFQVPSIETYYIFKTIIGASTDNDSCHLTSTITAYHKTLDDVPQGVDHAEVKLTPAIDAKPFYFGIYESGPLKGKTNPFAKGLTETSEDGGVAFFNVPPRDEPYVITAQKDGVTFTQATFLCRKGAFINISPPRGPMALTS